MHSVVFNRWSHQGSLATYMQYCIGSIIVHDLCGMTGSIAYERGDVVYDSYKHNK